MATLFLICAVAGGTLFVCQFVMLLLGFGGHHDIHFDHSLDANAGAGGHGHDVHMDGPSLIWSLLSFRPIVTGTAIFGFAGLGAMQANLAQPLPPIVAVASGFAGALMVAWMLRVLIRMQGEGTEDIRLAKGATGTVYISIPGANAGAGKVQLELQNRTIEVQAVTPTSALESGTKVVVVDVVNPETVEVIAVPQRSSL